MSTSKSHLPHPQEAAGRHAGTAPGALHPAAGARHGAHPASHETRHAHEQALIDKGYVPVRQLTGPVIGIWGDAHIRLADGEVRPLHVGDIVRPGDVVLTSQDGIVQIEASPAARLPAVLADNDVERTITRLNEGDLDVKPAAGPVAAGGSLEDGLRVGRDAESVSPESLAIAPPSAQTQSGVEPVQPQLAPGAPAANPDTESTARDTPVTFDPRGNDSSTTAITIVAVAGQHIDAATPVSLPQGTVSMNPDGTLTFTPHPGTTGSVAFTYTDQNAAGLTATSTVTVTVAGTNHAPVAVDDALTGQEGARITGNLAGNDTPSADGGNTWASATGPAHGTVTVNADGSFSYLPGAHYAGTDSFTYTVTDADGSQSTATVTLTIMPAPVANPDAFTGTENAPIAGSLAGNDTPSAGGGNTWALAGGPAHGGQLTVNPDGTFTYTPAPGFHGTDTFTYTLTDGAGDQSTATVTLTVGPAAPAAADDTVATHENAPVTGSLAGNDAPVAGETNTWAAGTPPAHGQVSVNADGTYTYTPAAGYVGSDSFTYTLTDGSGQTSTATVTVNVADTPPAAADDAASTPFGQPVTVAVLANDGDADGDALAVATVAGQPVAAGGAPVTVVENGVTEGSVALNADGTLTFTPAPGFSGTASFGYTITDGHGGSSAATVSIAVGVDHPPVAVSDTVSTNFDTPATVAVLANDSDPDGDALTITQVGGQAVTAGGPAVTVTAGGVTEGTVSLSADGKDLVFTPAGGHAGPATFTYTIDDGHGGTSTATVSLTVDTPPVAVPDATATAFKTPVQIDILANDSDANGDALTVTTVAGQPVTAGGAAVTVVVGGVTEGTVALGADGKTLTFTPADGYAGTASFDYAITDGRGGSSTATVSVQVGADHAPVAQDDAATTNYQTPVTIDVLHNDSDVDGDALTITQVDGHAITAGGPPVAVVAGGVTEGSVALNADGTLSFTPAAGYAGTARFTYTVSDGHGGTASADVTVNVDHPPVAVADVTSTDFNTAATVAVLTNDSDADGDSLTITQVAGQAITAGGAAVTVTSGGVAEGTVSLSADGKNLVFTPASGYTGPATFTYTIDDGHNGTSTASVTVNVDHPPIAAADVTSTDFNTAATVAVLGNDSDADGDTLTITQVAGQAITAGGAAVTVTAGGVTEGTVSLSTDGKNLVFTPANGYTGPATFTYTIDDGHNGTSTASVTVNVDHPPVAAADVTSTDLNTAATVAVLTNDSDADGDSLTITQVAGQAITAGGAAVTVTAGGVTEGTVSLSADGKNLVFTPANGYTGPATFTYTIDDGHNGTSTASVTVNVDHPPVAAADVTSTDFNTAATVAVLGNDSDADGDTLTITQVAGQAITAGGAAVTVTAGGVTEGTVSLSADGKNLVFTPANGYTGPATFTYTIDDGHSGTSTASVTVNVDHPPVAVADVTSTDFNTAATVAVLTNDSDADGDSLTITQIAGQAITAGGAAVTVTAGGVTEGTVSLSADGKNLVFTPANGYTGPATFTYTIDDGHNGTSTASVTVKVDHPPVAAADVTSTDFNTAATVAVLTNDSDADGDSLTITQVAGQAITAGGAAVTVTAGGVTEGTVSLSADGKNLVFTPANGYTGPATFTYTIDDGHNGTSTASVTVNVDHPPVAAADVTSTDFNTAATVAVLGNDSDADGDSLTITQVAGQAITAGGAAVTVISGGITEGTVSLSADGKNLVFTPANGYTGPATFTYTIDDGHNGTSTASVTVNVDHPPVATADVTSTDFNTAASVAVLGNDSDADGDTLTITQVAGQAITAGGAAVTVTAGGVTEGTVSLSADGKNLVFTPANGYTGPATFTYTIDDGHNGTSTASVTVNVDHPPVAAADVTSTDFNTAATVAVLTNDSDADGDTLTITQVAGQAITAGGAAVTVTAGGVTEGTVSLSADGKNLVFTPANGYTGPATFTYTIDDGHNGTSTASVTVNVDHPPVAAADVTSTDFNTAATFAVLTNDSDADGDSLTITQVAGQAITAGGAAVTVTAGGVAEGTVSLSADGKNLVFTPASGYSGPATFTYTIDDGHNGTSTATVTVNVDHPPVAAADVTSTDFNTAATVAVLGNDSDADGDTLTITQVAGQAIAAGGAAITVTSGGVTEGTVSLSADGKNLVFTPANGYSGPATFTYTIDDGHNGTSTASVTINVDHPPVAVADVTSTDFNTAATVTVLGNDSDADGDTLTITQVAGQAITAGGAAVTVTAGGVAEGTVSLSADGKNLVFTPANGYSGPATFTYTIDDGHNGTSTATVTVNVDHPPVAAADVTSTDFNTAATVAVLGNDSDADGDSLTITQVAGQAITAGGAAVTVTSGGVTEGTVSLSADGKNLVFTPANGYSGPATFTYTIDDGHNGTSTASVTINVDHPPVAVADVTSTDFNTAATVTVLGNDSDADGDTLTITQVAGQAITAGGAAVTVTAGGVAEGTVSLSADGKNLVFTPANGYTGPATFTYTIDDGHNGTSTATVTVNVDHPPVAAADVTSTDFNTAATVAVLGNDSDADGDTLTITQVAGQAITAGGAAVTVTAGGVTEGTVSLSADGKNLVFTPANGYTGPATFTYTIDDSHNGTSTASVTVNVDHPPVAAADVTSTDFNTAATVAVLGNDSDADGDTLTITQVAGQAITAGGAAVTVISGGVTEGTVSLSADGKNLVFTPANGYTGPATFTYTIDDGHNGTSTASVTVNVDHPPVATADVTSTDFNTAATVAVLGNDSDANGDSLTITQVAGQAITAGGAAVTVISGGVTEGTVSLSADGKNLVFTPANGYTGPATFTYTIDDGHNGTSTASVTINVDHPPVATADVTSTDFNTAATVAVLSNDSDADGDSLTITQVAGQAITAGGAAVTVTSGGVTEGTVSLSADGKNLVFTPANGYTGPATFTYTIDDGHNGTSTASVTVNVDHPPVATADVTSTDFNTAASVAVLGNDSDADGDTLTITQVAGQAITAGGAAVTVTSGGVTEGTVSLSADGKNLVFTPANGYTGPATFTYTIDDGHNGTSTASVTINVDHPPVATADVTSTDFNTTATVAVLGNDSDADGDTLTITQVAGQAITAGGAAVTVTSGGVTEGTVSLSADGKNLVFTPANGYSGPATFTYTIDDGHNGTSTASVTVNVDHPPVANPETFYTFMNQAAATPVLATATDPDGDTLTVTAINGTAIDAAHPVTTAHGVVSMDAGGNLTFTPATGYTGADSFTYTIDDGHGATSTATATVEVDATPSLQITANAYAVATNFEEVTLPAAGWTDAAVTQLGTGGTAASEGGAGVWHTDNAGNVVEIGTAATYSVLNYSSQVLELEANVNDASNLYTNLTTRAGELYTLSFDYAARNNNGAVTNSTVYVYWEGQLVDTLNTQSAQLTHYSLTLLATTTGANQLEFVAGDSNSYGGVLDNVQFGVQQNTGEQGYVVDLPQIAASVANTSGTETLSSVTLDSIPVGATLTDGTHTFTASAGSQVADITGWNMDSLSLTPTASLTGNLTLGVHAVATETATGITSQVDSSITLDVAADSGNVYGTAGDDTLTITDASIGSSSIRWGLDGNDSIVGSIGHDTLVGGAGNDTLVAGSGSTLLDGGTGNDSLVGGTGSDTLSGGAGNDTLTGGDGSDVFKWHLGDQGTTAVPAKDTITDFNTAAASSGGDVLDLRDLLVGESRPAGTTGAGDLTNYLHFSYANGDTTIHISTTGSVGTGEDQQIVLSGVDLVGTNTDAQIITTLLGEGKLITNGH